MTLAATLSTQDHAPGQADAGEVAAALGAKKFFWLDLDVGGPGADDAVALLRDTFKFHPLAVEDSQHFGQRPHIEDYDDYLHLVVYGAMPPASGPSPASAPSAPSAPSASTTSNSTGASDDSSQEFVQEVHIFVAASYVVTVHRGACTPLATVHDRIARHPHSETDASPHVVLLYLVVDSLTDSFFPILSDFDDRIDDLASAILVRPTDEQLATIFAMKRELLAIRKVVGPQRDMFAGIISGVTRLPGMTSEDERYFRDLYDHLIRIGDMVDGYRDLVSGAMDTHLSTVSNRLNVVMKQLAIIATIFLPLSFLTGFFGQNFSWLVTHLGGLPTFVGVGIGLEVVAVALLFILFKRRGWLGGPTA